MRTRLVIAPVLLLAATAPAQSLRTQTVLPQLTDPAISGWFGAHYTAILENAPLRNRLFLYIHGQGGNGGGATELVKTAAEQGFHAIGLTYPCDWSPFVECQGSGDPDCTEKLRRETIEGTDYSPFVSISRADSLENRLIKLLTFLNTAHPTDGWTQFLDQDQIRWDLIILWGHSQGGGNAGIIARHHALARACTSAPAADGGPGTPAPWWAQHATPSAAYYGFCHTQDSLATKVAFWNALGMGAFGPVIDIAAASPPYSGTHELSTSIAPAQPGQYHNSVVADGVTPRNAQGVPVYKPVWTYMIIDGLTTCYANCDNSTSTPILNVNDFSCFLNRFAAADPAANCDASTAAPVLNVNDFSCFLNAFAAGCS